MFRERDWNMVAYIINKKRVASDSYKDATMNTASKTFFSTIRRNKDMALYVGVVLKKSTIFPKWNYVCITWLLERSLMIFEVWKLALRHFPYN